MANVQKLFTVIPIVIMLFVPLSIYQGKIVHASLNPSSSDNTFNIPLAIPTTNKVNPLLTMEDEQQSVNNLTDNMMSNLQIRPQGSEDQLLLLQHVINYQCQRLLHRVTMTMFHPMW